MSLRLAGRMAGVERTRIRQIFDAAPPDAINLGLGEPDLPTPTRVSLAGIEGIARGHTSYTSTAGEPALRSAVASRYAPFAVGPENVVITVGSQEAVFASMLCLADPGDEVLYPDPGYPAYPVVARLVGATPVAYPLSPQLGFEVDPAEIESRVTNRTRVVILCSPSNPTGAVTRDESVRRLVRFLAEREVAWISDEIYGGFVYSGELSSPSHFSTDGGLVVSGLSKDLSMTGWRVGWVVGPAGLIEKITAAHHYLVTCASSVSQRAALATFEPEGDAERRAYLEVFRRRRDLMAAELDRIRGLRFAMPDGAFYFFADVSTFGNSLEIARRALERRKVITIPGEAFGQGGEGYLRLSFAATERQIIRGVQALGKELGEGRS